MKLRESLKRELESERKKDLLRLLLAFVLSVSVLYLGYKLWKDELKFIGRETTLIEAEVISEKRKHIGHGWYVQTGKCKFTYQSKNYTINFETKDWRKIYDRKEFEVGDSIILKIATTNPNISKFID